MKFLKLFLALSLALPFHANAAEYVERPAVSGNNLLKNPSFEQARSHWTLSAGTPSFDTVNYFPPGSQALKVSLSAVNGEVISNVVEDCYKLVGNELEFSLRVKTTLPNVQVCAWHAATEIGCENVNGVGTFQPTTVTAMAPDILIGTSCSIKVKTTSSATGDIWLDNGYVGLNRNAVKTRTANYFGGSFQPGTANCVYSQNTNSGEGTFTDLGAAGSCAQAWTSYGKCTAVGATSHQITCADMPPGEFKIEVSAPFYVNTQAVNTNFRFSDGTNVFGYNYLTSSTAGTIASATMLGNINYSTPGTRTFKIQSAISGAATSGIANSVAGRQFVWRIYHYPSEATSQQITPGANLLGTVFDAGPSATCPVGSVKLDGSTLSGSQYAALIQYNGTAVLQNRSGLVARGTGSQSINGRTKAGPTNPGNLQEDQFQGHRHRSNPNNANNLGDFTGGANLSTGGGAYGLYSTTGNADVSDGTNGTPRVGAETRVSAIGVTWCQWYVSQASALIRQSVIAGGNLAGVTTINKVTEYSGGAGTIAAGINDETFNLSPSGAVTLTLPPVASVPGKKYIIRTTGLNVVTIDPDGSETICGQTTIKVYGANDVIEVQAAGTAWIPVTKNGCDRIEGAIIQGSNGTPTASQIRPWIASISRTSTGLYTVNFTSGTFSNPPYCNINVIENVGTTAVSVSTRILNITTSAIGTSTWYNTTPADYYYTLNCNGPR